MLKLRRPTATSKKHLRSFYINTLGFSFLWFNDNFKKLKLLEYLKRKVYYLSFLKL